MLLGCEDIYNTSANRSSTDRLSPAGKFAMMTVLASAVGVGVALVLRGSGGRFAGNRDRQNVGKSQSLPAALLTTPHDKGNDNNNVTRCDVNEETGKTVWLAPIS